MEGSQRERTSPIGLAPIKKNMRYGGGSTPQNDNRTETRKRYRLSTPETDGSRWIIRKYPHA